MKMVWLFGLLSVVCNLLPRLFLVFQTLASLRVWLFGLFSVVCNLLSIFPYIATFHTALTSNSTKEIGVRYFQQSDIS